MVRSLSASGICLGEQIWKAVAFAGSGSARKRSIQCVGPYKLVLKSSQKSLTLQRQSHILSRVTEVYKGTQIVISTIQTAEKGWTARAEYAVPGEDSVQMETPATYATEEEARRAALQAAVESIDRIRAAKGKR
jgi:hypothetical protein